MLKFGLGDPDLVFRSYILITKLASKSWVFVRLYHGKKCRCSFIRGLEKKGDDGKSVSNIGLVTMHHVRNLDT